VLWAQSQSKGYGSALWGTYQQWQALGGQVRKGEHGSPVVYWGTYESKETPDERDERNGRHLFCKGYTVFNLEQVDGVKLPKRLDLKLSANERIARAESFFSAVGVQVRDGGNRAYYRPDTPEAVYMPGFDEFHVRTMPPISTHGCACSRAINGPFSRRHHKPKKRRICWPAVPGRMRRWQHDRALSDLHSRGQHARRTAL